MKYRITNRLRPIRIGMLSGFTSPESFVRCVELTTALWGARYNPILPALKSTDRWPEIEMRGPMMPAEVLARWSRNFDADIFTRMDDAAPELDPRTSSTMRGFFNTVPTWRTVRAANNGTDRYGVGYGLGLLELARDYIACESSFVHDPPRRIISPSITGHPGLSAAMFGKLDSSLANRYHGILADAGHVAMEVDVTDALRFALGQYITPLAMSERALRNERIRRHDFYLLREDDPFDLALFWNIRARESHLIPLTLDLLQDDAALEMLRSHLAADENESDSARRVLVGVAEEDEVDELLERLELQNPNVNHLLWPPPDEYGPSDFTPQVFSRTTTAVVSAEEHRVSVDVVRPEILRADWKAGFRFANDLTLRSVTGNHLPADAVPRDAMASTGDLAARPSEILWRAVPEGFAFFPYRDVQFEFVPPDARTIMRAFFSHAGFSSGTSEHGMLLEQLLERLGGYTASGVVTHQALTVPVKHLDGRGTIEGGALLTMLSHLGRDTALSVINLLVESGVFAQGMIQQCQLCNHRPWYPLAALGPRLLCEYCRGTFDAAVVGDRPLKSALRILPPLDLPGNREGLLAVLSVLNFLRGAFGSERFTIGAGVKIEGYGFRREYDLVALAGGLAGSTVLRILFCESSAHGSFDDADFERFERMLPYFPKAYFAFATLRDNVSDEELARIRSFARTKGPAGKSQHKVIVLTGLDLTPRGDRYTPEYHGPDLRYFVEERAALLAP